MKTKIIFGILFGIFIASCEPRTNSSDLPLPSEMNSTGADPKQIEHVKNILEGGRDIYKKNCAVCHRPGGVIYSTEEKTTVLKKNISEISAEEFAYYVAYVKDSKSTEQSTSRFPRIASPNPDSTIQHNFGRTLSDCQIQLAIEYIWITNHQQNKH